MEGLKILIEKRTKEMNDEKTFIHSKIDFWLNKIEVELNSSNVISQKRKELIDLGKFIYCFNQDINVIDALCESPDFLISFGNKNIGIELTDLVIRDSEKQKEGLLKKLFTQIEIELRTESIDFNGIYRVDFIKDISLNQKNQNEIKSEILNLIRLNINSGELVKEIRKTYHTDISIYHSEASVVGSLDRITVENKITKKEAKISNYSQDRFKEIWLLLVIGGVQTSDDYSFIEEQVTNIPFKTNFDKVFILDFFKSNILELITSK